MLEFSTRGDFGSRTPRLVRRDLQRPEPRRRRLDVAPDRGADRRRHAPAARPDDGLDDRPGPAHAPRRSSSCASCRSPIPAIVIVVGIAPIYRCMGQHLGAVGASPLTLALIDIILVLPFAYRAIDASLRSIDTATLAEAARSLGAGWPRTIFQVIVPNIRGGDRVGVGPRDRAGARRVHDLVAALVQHAPGRDLPARQARSVHRGRRVLRRPRLRVRPADRHHPLRAPAPTTADRPAEEPAT